MIHDFDIKSTPDIVCVDNRIPDYDVVIIKQRYKMNKIYKLRSDDANIPNTQRVRAVNLNMISTNIIFLAIIHIRNVDIAKMNQLMLDFEITEFEIEYILTFIDEAYKLNQNERGKYMLESLKEAFTFYSNLIARNGDAIRQIIDAQNDEIRAYFLKTLVMQVRMMYPLEGDTYSGYEVLLLQKIDELYAKSYGKQGGDAQSETTHNDILENNQVLLED
jgi:hypothetical protein